MITTETLNMALQDYVLPILIFFAIAYIIHRLSDGVARRLRVVDELTRKHSPERYERLKTLRSLVSNAISILAFTLAGLLSLSLFVGLDTLIWVVGLFSAAFGLGARPFISDFLTGLSFIFEDTFDVGDKIEIPMMPQRVEGVVEEVTLRITRIRGMDGELYTMPNGDIRLVRNFSRGSFSPTSVSLSIPADQIPATLDRLEAMKQEVMTLLPNLIEPWQVISKSGELGEKAELTVLAKARFGKGAELRTNMLTLLQQRLADLQIKPETDADKAPPV